MIQNNKRGEELSPLRPDKDFSFLYDQIKEPLLFQKPSALQLILFNRNFQLPNTELLRVIVQNSIVVREQSRIYDALVINDLIYIKEQQKSDLTSKLLVMNYEFSNLTIMLDSSNLKKGLILERHGSTQKILFQNYQEKQQQIKYWGKTLNKYAFRKEPLQKYNLVKKLGEGGQARVYKIIKKNDQCTCQYTQNECAVKHKVYAVKIIDINSLKSTAHKQQLIQKLNVMRRLNDCGNALRLLKVYINKSYMNLFLEYQEGGCLQDMVKTRKGASQTFSEEELKLIAAQLLLTVDYMHSRGIIHRDIKPANILLNSNKEGIYDVRLADFGFSILKSELQSQLGLQACGTPGYLPPEALRKKGYAMNSDVFSVGCILFKILTTRNLFPGANFEQTVVSNKECDQKQIRYNLLGTKKEIKSLLLALLQDNPKLRPTAREALQYKWFDSMRDPITQSIESNDFSRDNDLFQENEESLKSQDLKIEGIYGGNCSQIKTIQYQNPRSTSPGNFRLASDNNSCNLKVPVFSYFKAIDDHKKASDFMGRSIQQNLQCSQMTNKGVRYELQQFGNSDLEQFDLQGSAQQKVGSNIQFIESNSQRINIKEDAVSFQNQCLPIKNCDRQLSLQKIDLKEDIMQIKQSEESLSLVVFSERIEEFNNDHHFCLNENFMTELNVVRSRRCF